MNTAQPASRTRNASARNGTNISPASTNWDPRSRLLRISGLPLRSHFGIPFAARRFDQYQRPHSGPGTLPFGLHHKAPLAVPGGLPAISVLQPEQRQLKPVACTDFLKKAPKINLDGALADAQTGCDLFVLEPLSQQGHQLALAVAQVYLRRPLRHLLIA